MPRAHRKSTHLRRPPLTLLLLLAALLHGLLYLWLIPPWQHYDEPSHFEYARLLASNGTRPDADAGDPALRRAIATSMATHGFYGDGTPPDLSGDAPVNIGIPAFSHPPGYYALASLPLVLLPTTALTSIESQLYAARAVSLLLYLLTVAVAIGTMRDLTAPASPLRWAVPAVLVLLPPFVDLMTAVNSDVGAVALASLFLWLAVRVVRDGLHPRAQVGLFVLVAALLPLFKNTAAVLVLLVPAVLLLALWRQRGWQWRWLFAGAGAAALVLLLLVLSWGDAAGWYRVRGSATQPTATRANVPTAPHGTHAFTLAHATTGDDRHLAQPLLTSTATGLAGETVTLGGWLWADQPITAKLDMDTATRPGEARDMTSPLLAITTTPTFYAASFAVPADATAVTVALVLPTEATTAAQPVTLYADGLVLAAGDYPSDTAPTFATAAATTGDWDGQPFTNLLRNASAEAGALRLQPWVIQTLGGVVSSGGGRNLSQFVTITTDSQRTGAVLLADGTLFIPFDTLFNGIAWGQVRLEMPGLVWLTRGLLLAAVAGAGLWLWRTRRSSPPAALLPMLAILAGALVLVWGAAITRALPRVYDGFVFAVARYTYPAIMPTALLLVAGWREWWHPAWRHRATVGLLAALGGLALASIARVWHYYYG